ncbi:uncharacterized protein [Drosophila virilis]|uniref:Uncharacterized protein, isoform A n=2 Tax=Drosophila virilis TaxID=7244 RepID=B4M9M7_DROVI|nr:uncharacterized protein LOC6634009 isoform X1 [Drosophila virilis]EDW57903.2 uncharacterized protein Dvir_GJ17884, isoform A [Drosophila virilis]
MNPNCQTDINSAECQKWMREVCAHCRELFAREATDKWAAWWHDATPALFKDVPDMTVYDCNKLKHLLELEVAAIRPPEVPMQFPEFTWWQKALLISVYIGILVLMVLMCRYWRRGRRVRVQSMDEEKAGPQRPINKTPPQSEQKTQAPPSTPPAPHPQHEDVQKPNKSRHTFKAWMRHRCRPIFVHNEASLRRQQAKYKANELIREAHNQQNIEKWTRAREEVEKRRQERKDSLAMDSKRKDTQHLDENQHKHFIAIYL